MAAKSRTSPVAKKATKRATRAKQILFRSGAELAGFLQSEAAKDSLYRMVAKGQEFPSDPEPAPEPAPEPEPSSPNSGTWGSKPSVAQQIEKHPTTVREKTQVTCQFVLSDADALTAWNKLQVRMHPPTAPQVRLVNYACEFSPAISSFVILVSYSELEYQQI